MRSSGSGNKRVMRTCALFFCLAAAAIISPACVKRAPRPDQEKPPEQSASPRPDKPCGLTCRIKQHGRQPREAKKQEAPARESGADVDRSANQEHKAEAKSWPWRKKEEAAAGPSAAPAPTGTGVYHTVKKGETFYRICKTYGADQNDVARANHLADVTCISVGQRLWIPGADKTLHVPPAPTAYSGPSKSGPPIADPPPSATRGTFILPVPKAIVTSPFGERDGRMHEGIDLAAPVGTPVYAADDGKVVYEGDDIRGYGNMIIIKHAGNLTTVYAHNRRNLVKTGELVKKGQKIAEVGQTGRATGPHCHFEVRIGERPVNPQFYLP